MTQPKRAIFLTAAVAVAATQLFGRPVGAQQASTLTHLRLGATKSDDMTPIVYGQQAGIFAKHGLILDVFLMRDGAASVAGMISGSFDLGKSSIPNFILAYVKGLPISFVSAAVINDFKTLFAAFILRKDSPIRTGQDFNGQIVSVAGLGDIGNLALSQWVDQHGGDAKSIRFVEVPMSAAGAATDTGRVVAAEITQPALNVALETGRLRIMPILDALGDGYLETAWATTKDFSTGHPDLIRAFAAAWAEAATYTNAHHRETAALMSDYTGISLDLISKMPRVVAGTRILPQQIQPIIDAMVKYGQLKNGFLAADLIDQNIR
jgi:NitT/TauT family transport system substrate-binding protein